MVIINYSGRRDVSSVSLDGIVDSAKIPQKDGNMNVSADILPQFYSTSTPYMKYKTQIPEYSAHEVDFIAAGTDFVVKGMFIPGNSKPYVLRNLPGPEKYITLTHELVHSEFHDAGIPQSEYEVRRVTSERTNFKDYYA